MSSPDTHALVIPSFGGPIQSAYHPSAGGGLGGPAGGVYIRLAEILAVEDIASLRLDYRHPGNLEECLLDVSAGLAFLVESGRTRVIRVGHSFGGAVVIQAGSREPSVVAVAALSSQKQGVTEAAKLSPKPLLLIHGTADEVLPEACSRTLYRWQGAEGVGALPGLSSRAGRLQGRTRPGLIELGAEGEAC